ncbi:MAG TPA: hypothetical protein VIK14_00920 [Ignavibacteria bacterium]
MHLIFNCRKESSIKFYNQQLKLLSSKSQPLLEDFIVNPDFVFLIWAKAQLRKDFTPAVNGREIIEDSFISIFNLIMLYYFV